MNNHTSHGQDADSHRHEDDPRPVGFWRSNTGLVTIGFLAIGAFFLVAEHRAHLVPLLGYAFPFLLLLACLPMHFMHGGHSGHGGGARDDDSTDDNNKPTPHHH